MKKELTQAEIKERLDYDPVTGKMYWKNGTEAGNIDYDPRRDAYRWKIGIGGQQYFRYRLVWLYHHGKMPTMIDHINVPSTDDRIENLREASAPQNGANRGKNKNNRTGFKGVIKIKDRPNNPFKATLCCNYKRHYLGSFPTAELAHEAYKKAAVKYFGEFAGF